MVTLLSKADTFTLYQLSDEVEARIKTHIIIVSRRVDSPAKPNLCFINGRDVSEESTGENALMDRKTGETGIDLKKGAIEEATKNIFKECL